MAQTNLAKFTRHVQGQKEMLNGRQAHLVANCAESLAHNTRFYSMQQPKEVRHRRNGAQRSASQALASYASQSQERREQVRASG
jgi:hypothetical protein